METVERSYMLITSGSQCLFHKVFAVTQCLELGMILELKK